MKHKGHVPDQALVSSSCRTRETWGLLGLDAPAIFMRALYEADAERMFDILQGATGDRVLMLGHNPGICLFAHMIVAHAPDHERWDDYPTGSTLVVRFETLDWASVRPGSGVAIDFAFPRELEKAASV